LRRCDKGQLVQALQAQLATELRIDLAIDGLFGDNTAEAVRRYQAAHGLEVDGLVGPATWNALFGSRLPDAGTTRGISDDWFGRPATEAVLSLQEAGFVVIDYQVCSSSVAAGAVRQIASGDGTIYVDEAGVTQAGKELPIGSVIEVKVGNGQSC
jgi:peptidoglycan hydrolase-like protein with peptidoglycan-binding domain